MTPPRAARVPMTRERRFFLVLALSMVAVNVLGFSVQFAFGRSSFHAPALVHAHALLFMGWVGFFAVQTTLGARGSLALHRRLGWVGAGWAIAMVVVGTVTTVVMVREGRAPFFFTPGYFLPMNVLGVVSFALLLAAAIRLRRRRDWHPRLVLSAMAGIMGPAVGRLLPMPLLVPWSGQAVMAAILLFPLTGAIRDRRRDGRVHPAWWWGMIVIVVTQLAATWLPPTRAGLALYSAVVAGSPGERIAPVAYPAPPPAP
ncbi:hypothetical protein ASG29_10235 [Sphingomonas sp. Leaf412]|nr:hypothetical protein ASG29_10235 [Sphingomonas sp. Leaf412]